MSNWLNKHFFKSKAVKVNIYFPDHRVKTYYVIPKDENIIIKDKEFKINKDNIYYDEKRFPTYHFRFNDAVAVNILNTNDKPILDPVELYTQSESSLARQFIRGMGGGLDMNMIILIVLGVMVILMGFGLYTIYNEVKDLNEVIGGLVNV